MRNWYLPDPQLEEEATMKRRIWTTVAVLAIAASVVTGCATAQPDLDKGVAATMQTSVLSIAESAASGDLATANAHLDELQSRLKIALAEGDVTEARAAEIQAAIDLVRADLQPPTPTEAPAPVAPADTGDTTGGEDPPDNPGSSNSGDGNGSNNGNGNGGNGNGNGGNGNGNGGNGKGKDK
jgi:uncharacterized membrane protein YgcG